MVKVDLKKKLPPEFKAKWVEALRSGKYKQVTGRLHKKTGFCCLGVACEINRSGWEWQYDEQEEAFITPFGSGGVPGREDVGSKVYEVLTQRLHRPDLEEHDVMSFITSHNDIRAWNFNQIADWIEENL